LSCGGTEKSHNLDRQNLIEKEKVIEALNKCVDDKNKVIANLEQSLTRRSLVNSKFKLLEVTNKAKLLKTKSSNSWIVNLK
jgi:hypothetical protein